MKGLATAGLAGLLLAGCARPPPPAPPAAPPQTLAAGTAGGSGSGDWEPAPTTAAPLRPQRDNGRRGLSVSRSPLLSGTGARGAMGWPDRYQGDLGGAPYRPQY